MFHVFTADSADDLWLQLPATGTTSGNGGCSVIKRPLNARFSEMVKQGIKITTIRDKPWPVGIPIMLYDWTGKPYRSPQCDVAVIIVMGFWTIQIAHMQDDSMRYAYGMENAKPLHETEGFESSKDLDNWFRPLVQHGTTITKHLMRFKLWERGEE